MFAASYQGLYFYNPYNLFFEQIPGIITSCWSIIPFKESILAATSQGVFEINNFSAKLITKNFSLSIYQSTSDASRVYIGLTEGLSCIQYNSGTWNIIIPKYEIKEEVRDIIEDKFGFLWLNTTTSGIIRYDISELAISDIEI